MTNPPPPTTKKTHLSLDFFPKKNKENKVPSHSRFNGSENVLLSYTSGLPNRREPLLLLLLLGLNIAATMHGRMSALTPGAAVDSAGCVPWAARACPAMLRTAPIHHGYGPPRGSGLCRCSHVCFIFSSRFFWQRTNGKSLIFDECVAVR